MSRFIKNFRIIFDYWALFFSLFFGVMAHNLFMMSRYGMCAINQEGLFLVYNGEKYVEASYFLCRYGDVFTFFTAFLVGLLIYEFVKYRILVREEKRSKFANVSNEVKK